LAVTNAGEDAENLNQNPCQLKEGVAEKWTNTTETEQGFSRNALGHTLHGATEVVEQPGGRRSVRPKETGIKRELKNPLR